MKSTERIIPGLHIQWPWSRLLVSSEKLVETRSYPLPEKFVGLPLALIETPGRLGKKNGIETKIIAVITFEHSYLYRTQKQWLAEYSLHLVSPQDPAYGFTQRKPKWGWKVQECFPVSPTDAPRVRGIIFAKDCRVRF